MTKTITSPGFSLVMRHWTNGGTGITNFPKHELENYRKALDVSKREDLIVCSVGFSIPSSLGISNTQESLHQIGHKDTKSFFDELSKIRKSKD